MLKQYKYSSVVDKLKLDCVCVCVWCILSINNILNKCLTKEESEWGSASKFLLPVRHSLKDFNDKRNF